MSKDQIKKLALQIGPLLLGGLAFIATSIADAISQKNEEDYIDERVREEVERQLMERATDEEEPVEELDDKEDEESEIEVEEP